MLVLCQAHPDATILGVGGWDSLYHHDTNVLKSSANKMHTAIARRSNTPLCPQPEPAVLAQSADAATHAADDVPVPVGKAKSESKTAAFVAPPAVFWVTAPRPVVHRLKTPEKRQFMTEENIVKANKILSKPSTGPAEVFTAVIDLFAVRKAV